MIKSFKTCLDKSNISRTSLDMIVRFRHILEKKSPLSSNCRIEVEQVASGLGLNAF